MYVYIMYVYILIENNEEISTCTHNRPDSINDNQWLPIYAARVLQVYVI